MFIKNTILLGDDEEDDFSYLKDDFPSQFFLVPKTDHNINLFLKSKINAYLNIPLPNLENKDNNQIKEEEDVLFFNNISLSENNLKFSPIEVKDEIKNGIIPELSNKNQDFFNKYLEPNIIISNECSSKKKIGINQKKIFITVYPKKISLFSKAKGEFVFPGLKQEDKLIGNKRRRNKEDDIRRMIGRRFFNDIVLNLINGILKNAGSIISFEKIQQDVVYDLVKKNNKKLLDMSLEQIFTKKDLYRGKNLEKYNHNLKLINLLKSEEYNDIRQSTQIDRILNLKYYDLFQEYITSNEFVEEINRLKNNKMKFDDSYIEKYIYYSLNFINNFLD